MLSNISSIFAFVLVQQSVLKGFDVFVPTLPIIPKKKKKFALFYNRFSQAKSFQFE